MLRAHFLPPILCPPRHCSDHHWNTSLWENPLHYPESSEKQRRIKAQRKWRKEQEVEMATFMQQSSMCRGPEPCATCGKHPRVAGASGMEREVGRREGADSKGPSRTTYHTLDFVLHHHLSNLSSKQAGINVPIWRRKKWKFRYINDLPKETYTVNRDKETCCQLS